MRRRIAIDEFFGAHWMQEYDRQEMIYLAKRVYRK
jgi:hypothetical protein